MGGGWRDRGARSAHAWIRQCLRWRTFVMAVLCEGGPESLQEFQKATKPFATHKLKDLSVPERFYVDISNRFAVLQQANDFSEQWKLFQDTVKESAEIVLGCRKESRKEQWITED